MKVAMVLGVEDGARSASVDQEVGFLTMDDALHHDMEAFSFDIQKPNRDVDIASHQKFGLMAYFL